MSALRRVALGLVTVGATACATSSPADLYGQEEVVILQVSSERISCVGEMRGICLQVRSSDQEEWRIFYDPIEGFEYEEGTAYTLEVGRRAVLDPPADGSAYVYRLIRILSEQPGAG